MQLITELERWARKCKKSVHVVVPPHVLPGTSHWIRNETFHLGNCTTISDGLRDFLKGECKTVSGLCLDTVNIDGIIEHADQLLSTPGYELSPAMCWVTDATFTLRTVEKIPENKCVAKYLHGFAPSQLEPIIIPFARVDKLTSLMVRPSVFSWSERPGYSHLSRIEREYKGSRTMRRRAFSVGLLSNCSAQIKYIKETDFLPAHAGVLVRGANGAVSHSRHPFVAIGRVRRDPSFGLAQREAVFDYWLITLSCEDSRIIGVTRQCVNFFDWLAKSPAIKKSLQEVFWKEDLDPALHARRVAGMLRSQILSFLGELYSSRMDGYPTVDRLFEIDYHFEEFRRVVKDVLQIRQQDEPIPTHIDATLRFRHRYKDLRFLIENADHSRESIERLYRVFHFCVDLADQLDIPHFG